MPRMVPACSWWGPLGGLCPHPGADSASPTACEEPPLPLALLPPRACADPERSGGACLCCPRPACADPRLPAPHPTPCCPCPSGLS